MGCVFFSNPSTSFAEQELDTRNYDGNKIVWTWDPFPFSSSTKPRGKPSKLSAKGVSNAWTKSSTWARVAWSCILLRVGYFSRVRKWTRSFAPCLVRFHGGCETFHHNILIVVGTKNWIYGPPQVGHVSVFELSKRGGYVGAIYFFFPT